FEYPVLDEERYVEAAHKLAAGGLAEDHAYFQPPGIIYVLAATFRVAGPGLAAPRYLQALASAVSCLLLFLVTRRLVGPRVALAACAIAALHGVLVFECYELLPPTWILLFDLLALWLLLEAGDRGTLAWSFAAGVALGTSAVFSPTVLPFAAIAAVWLRRPRRIA